MNKKIILIISLFFSEMSFADIEFKVLEDIKRFNKESSFCNTLSELASLSAQEFYTNGSIDILIEQNNNTTMESNLKSLVNTVIVGTNNLPQNINNDEKLIIIEAYKFSTLKSCLENIEKFKTK